VTPHVLMCFLSQDPVVSLDPVTLRLVVETEEEARGSVEEATKITAAWFKRLPEDA
jgi:hypothetical protein